MAEGKMITVQKPGGSSYTEIEVFPGDSVAQVCTMVAPELGLPAAGDNQLVGPDQNRIEGDVYKAVKPGDVLTLIHKGVGG